MTSIYDLVGSNCLKASDVAESTPTVQLSGFKKEQLDGQTKGIAMFHGMQKGLVVNVMNAEVLVRMLGTTVFEEWTPIVQATPKWVTLYTEPTPMGDGIRIREAAPSQPTDPAPPADTPAMDPAMMQQFAAFQQFLASQKPQQ